MNKVRTVFEKKGRAKYISHLDLNRFMLRAFRRTKLPIWYTEGYNPHPYIAFALALSLGYESECEIMDFNLNEDIEYSKIIDKLNSVMPEGIRFKEAFAPVRKITEIAKSCFDIRIKVSNPAHTANLLKEFINRDKIIVEKKTKKGMTEIDIKPHIEVSEIISDDMYIYFSIILPAGTQVNYNPSLLLDTFKNAENSDFEMINICRKSIICSDGEKFL